ncbi:MAG: hypothetical protein FJ272_02220, partial [Planctomycetes bacterium]|nr:hypothetical protein [Planctomycetota bacterium]
MEAEMTKPGNLALLGLMGVASAVLAACVTVAGQDAVGPLTAHWGNLEGPWLFRTDPDDIGEKQGWEKPNLDETGWRTIRVPGCWEAQGVTDPRPGQPPKPKPPRVPWTDYDGVAWYRLHFVVPKEWQGQELLLR